MKWLSVVFLSLAVSAYAEIYKWVDKQGNVHFGDKKSVVNVKKVEEVETKAQSNSYEVKQETKQKQQKLLDAWSEERDLKAEAKTKRKAELKERKATCERKRKYLQRYKNSQYIYDESEDGGRTILSNEKRVAEEKSIKDFIKKNCKRY